MFIGEIVSEKLAKNLALNDGFLTIIFLLVASHLFTQIVMQERRAETL